MSDFEFDPDVIRSLPARLQERGADLHGAGTLPSPDAGVATAEARDAISHIESLAASVVESVDDLAAGLQGCLQLYAGADNTAAWLLEFHMKSVL